MKTALIIAIQSVVLCWPTYADTLVGKVTKVADGDTITILDSKSEKVRIRLSGIDAPEATQAHGEEAKRYLSDLVLSRAVTVKYEKLDRYGRIIGVVLLNGKDVNYQIIKSGFAWHYKQYQNEQTRKARKLYSEGEESARQKRTGLWIHPSPTPPWVWRKIH